MKQHHLFWIGTPLVMTGFVITLCLKSAGGDEAAATKQVNYTVLLEQSQQTQPANLAKLSPEEQLGKNLFFDTTLSDPVGMACATCHAPGTGFTGPSSEINQDFGVMPGADPGRFGHRKPQMMAYSAFSPTGPYFDEDLGIWLGGNFWDGRATDQAAQARMPFIDPNEMNNPAVGPLPPHSGGSSSHVVAQVKKGKNFALFQQVFGADVASESDADFYLLITHAIAEYEASLDVNQFSSRFDRNLLTTSAERGRKLFFNQAQCFQCHSSATLAPVLAKTGGKDAFTMYCYANIGVPRNPDNPFYKETSASSNPLGYNSKGTNFVDFGLGGNPNVSLDGSRFMTSTPGDIAEFRGLFKAPSLRNSAKIPKTDFVKAYMHNGVFKSLEEVVHFYNKRNLARNSMGKEVAFDLRKGPPAGYTRFFPAPEVIDNVQNVSGVLPTHATGEVASNGQVGNLGLTAQDEADIVNFLRALTDGQ